MTESNREPPPRELPRLGLLRDMTDRAMLAEVFARGRVTRAELAAITGISKPTTSQSVRRLEDARLLRAAGPVTGRRGRVATFYELSPEAGWVCAAQVDQRGLRVQSADLLGTVFRDRRHPPSRPGDRAALTRMLRQALTDCVAAGSAHGPLRAGAISVANPVDPATNHIIAMPDSPFPEGELPLDEILADVVAAPLLVDNDVNLAASAERHVGSARSAASFAYVYVGAGMGMGLYIGDHAVRGAHGLAGEIGELAATAARRPTLARALHQAGFGTAESPSVDVGSALRALNGTGGAAIGRIASVIAQAIAATCAIIDPELVVLGGPIAGHPAMLEPVRTAVAAIWPGPVVVETGSVIDQPALQGALQRALGAGRDALLGATG